MGMMDTKLHRELMGTTAMVRVLQFIFDKAVRGFENMEIALTGKITRENPQPYLH